MNYRSNVYLSRHLAGGMATLVILLGGCASAQPPSVQLTSTLATAHETVSQAREAEAAEFAPMELQSAEEKLAAAQIAIAKEDNELAGRLASEAMVDARLAAVKARSAKSQAVALDLQKSIQTLREEIARKSNG